MEWESNSSFPVSSHGLENTSTFTEITSNIRPHFTLCFKFSDVVLKSYGNQRL